MRVLVTGGAGFIGSHLVGQLLGLGHEVWVLDTFERGSLINLVDAGDESGIADAGLQLHITRGAVTWAADVEAVMREARPEIVYHLAAQTDVGVSMQEPIRDYTTNVTGTVRMLEAAKRHARRFVFVSSAAIFGNVGPPTLADAGERRWRLAPISPYGASKVAAEAYVDVYDAMSIQGHHNMTTSTLVFSNVYGPRQHATRGVVNLFARALLAGEPVTLHGDGRNVRDYLYVADAARALVWAGGLLPPVDGKRDLGPVGPALVGTGVGTTDIDLVQMLCQQLWSADRMDLSAGVPLPMVYGPARSGDIRSSVFPAADMATTGLYAGLALTVEALRKEGL